MKGKAVNKNDVNLGSEYFKACCTSISPKYIDLAG
jgi:hypothetical protein